MQSRSTPHLLQRTVKQMEKSWEKHLPMFIDVDNNYLISNEAEAITNLISTLERATMNGYKLIPVTRIERHKSYQDVIRLAMQTDKNGVCIRLGSNDWGDLTNINPRLDKLLSYLAVLPKQTYVVLDFGPFLPEQTGTIIASAVGTINTLKNLNNFCSLIITSTAIPERPQVSSGDVKRMERSEWIVWQALRKTYKDKIIKRLPVFGDYTMVNPSPTGIKDFTKVKLLPKIKYCTNEDWLFIREQSKKRRDYAKFHEVCQLLIAQPEYCGQTYSWGDKCIYECATNASTSTNPKQWSEIGINHHITLATRQCSSFP
jgi:hypothetical protein